MNRGGHLAGRDERTKRNVCNNGGRVYRAVWQGSLVSAVCGLVRHGYVPHYVPGKNMIPPTGKVRMNVTGQVKSRLPVT